MIFNSSVFLYFFIIVLILYWPVARFKNGKTIQNALLLLASYFFYGWWDWLYLGLILISTFIDYFVAKGIHATESKRSAKLLLTVSIVANIGILSIFKYYDFFIGSFIESAAGLHAVTGWNFLLFDQDSLLLKLLLPVGISFYTFQTVSYSIDVYRGVIEPEENKLNFALFVCFFPQLVAGPIERAQDLLPQIRDSRSVNYETVVRAIWLILLGYFMKVHVADHLGELVDKVYYSNRATYEQAGSPIATNSTPALFFTVIAFAFQVYGDFAGYSNIARGTALLLGIRLSENFASPEFAKNPADLYNRWHITLIRWFTDYVYIPLGGSRMGLLNQYRNVLIIFTLSGLWHGASWTFVLWGAMNGFILVIYLILSRQILPLTPIGRWLENYPIFRFSWVQISRLITFSVFASTGVFFRAHDMNQAIEAYKLLLFIDVDWRSVYQTVEASEAFNTLLRYTFLLIIFDAFHYKNGEATWITRHKTYILIPVILLLFFIIVIYGIFGKAVIYFAF